MTSIILSKRMPVNAVDLVMTYLPPHATELDDPQRIVIKDVRVKHISTRNDRVHFCIIDEQLLQSQRFLRMYENARVPFTYDPSLAGDWILGVEREDRARFRHDEVYVLDLALCRKEVRGLSGPPMYKAVITKRQYVGREGAS